MATQKATPTEKKQIIDTLIKMNKKFGSAIVKPVITGYFKNYSEKLKAEKKISELKEELAKLEKKK